MLPPCVSEKAHAWGMKQWEQEQRDFETDTPNGTLRCLIMCEWTQLSVYVRVLCVLSNTLDFRSAHGHVLVQMQKSMPVLIEIQLW